MSPSRASRGYYRAPRGAAAACECDSSQVARTFRATCLSLAGWSLRECPMVQSGAPPHQDEQENDHDADGVEDRDRHRDQRVGCKGKNHHQEHRSDVAYRRGCLGRMPDSHVFDSKNGNEKVAAPEADEWSGKGRDVAALGAPGADEQGASVRNQREVEIEEQAQNFNSDNPLCQWRGSGRATSPEAAPRTTGRSKRERAAARPHPRQRS